MGPAGVLREKRDALEELVEVAEVVFTGDVVAVLALADEVMAENERLRCTPVAELERRVAVLERELAWEGREAMERRLRELYVELGDAEDRLARFYEAARL